MRIFDMDVKDITPYANNPRKNDKAVAGVAASIREFGFKVPIVLDKNGEIINGHTRLKAAKKLGLKTVPCIIADDLDEEQVKAFRLADNKVSEAAEWDMEKLNGELRKIDLIDMEQFDFEIPGFDDPEEDEPEDIYKPDDEYYGDERERTFESVNLNDVDLSRVTGKYQMPTLKATDHVPEDLISFNYVLSASESEFKNGVHFYIDDYQFERIWNRPQFYMDKLLPFDCVLTPDFSLYTEMPIAMQIWNVFRSRLIGQIMQDNGLTVIPTLQWCRPESYDFCFDGIEPGGVVSVSTIGVKREESASKLWFDGMDEAMRRLKPKCVVVYGGDIGYKFSCPAVYIDNHNAERLANGR